MSRAATAARLRPPPAAAQSGLALRRSCACGTHGASLGPCRTCAANATLQRSADDGRGGASAIPPNVHTALRDPGARLDPPTRQFMERGFRHDFGAVRVHTGGRAAASARDVGATAYTLGKNIVFGEGQYAPAAPAGRRLLAHELAHVVQQSRASAAPGEAGTVGAADHPLEHEAAAQSERVLAGGESAIAGAPAGPVLLRQAGGAPPAPPAPPPAGPRDTHTPDPNLALPKAHATSNWGLGAFESRLESDNVNGPCVLTLSLKLAFDFVDTPAGFPDDSGAPIPGAVTRTKWTGAEQDQWRSAFIREVTNRWSNRYPLAAVDNNCLWALAICNQAIARVEVIPAAPAAGIPTVKVSHQTGYRSGATGQGAWMTREDVIPGANAPGQVTVEHEFGHMIGLEHSNPACQSTDAASARGAAMNATNCYGVTPSQIADVMGQGSIVTPQDYRPFVVEMKFFTGCDWQTVGSAPEPPKQSALAAHAGLLGGALAGAATGALIGAAVGGGVGAAVGGLLGLLVGGLTGLIVDEVRK